MGKRIFSGIQPSGTMHLGNYMGALEQWLRIQHEYECIFAVVDLHALTSKYAETEKIPGNIKNMVLDWLGAGLDYEKNILYVQSRVPQHSELHLLLSMITPLSWLERVPAYKDKITQLGINGKDINTYGFLGYPELMTADILLYETDLVPVGEDQNPHLELAREIARRFNNFYGETFKEPQGLIGHASLLPGTDGRKMSKSYGNDIAMIMEPKEMAKKISSLVTDPQRIKKTDKGHPEVCTAFKYHKLFNAEAIPCIESECRKGAIGCVECKKRLAAKMAQTFMPMYERRQKFAEQPDLVEDILNEGTKKAASLAEKMMDKVYKAMHLR